MHTGSTALALENEVLRDRLAEARADNAAEHELACQYARELADARNEIAELKTERTVAMHAGIEAIKHQQLELLSAQATIARLREAIKKCLDENGHLADGDVCTLIDLKRALALPSDDSALREFGMRVLQKWEDDALMSQSSFEQIVDEVLNK